MDIANETRPFFPFPSLARDVLDKKGKAQKLSMEQAKSVPLHGAAAAAAKAGQNFGPRHAVRAARGSHPVTREIRGREHG